MIALSFSAPCYNVNTECKQTHYVVHGDDNTYMYCDNHLISNRNNSALHICPFIFCMMLYLKNLPNEFSGKSTYQNFDDTFRR